MMKSRKSRIVQICSCVLILIASCMISVYAEELGAEEENQTVIESGFQVVDNQVIYLLPDGTRFTGWTEIEGKKFYFSQDGYMQRGESIIDGHSYQFLETGELLTGWYEKDGKRFYKDQYGMDEFGIIQDHGNVYYIDQTGLKTGDVVVQGVVCHTNETGKIDLEGNFLAGKESNYDEQGFFTYGWKVTEGGYAYVDRAGNVLTGLQTIGGQEYYFTLDGNVLLNHADGLYAADEVGRITRLPVTVENLNMALDEILAQTGNNIANIGNYVNTKLKYKYIDKMATREEMAAYALNNRKCSCYYYEALCGLLLERAGYQVITVKGKGQVYAEHYWSLVSTQRNGVQGWYHVDALKRLYVKTDAELVAEKFVWNHADYPATP